jgi:tryptophanyl-tRNA synthetase
MNLQDPTARMSTTYGSEQGTVYILDEADAVRKKVRSAVTDSGTDVRRGPDKEGITNLIDILSVIRDVTPEDIEREFEDSGYGDFKGAVADAVVDYLAPVRERYAELRPDEAALESILGAGAEKARAISSGIVADVRDAMGIGPPRA